MNQSSTLIANAIGNFDEFGEHVQVSASHKLIELVSDELYRSPLKAIEELVVNAYDADASECRVYVPLPSNSDQNCAIVFDDGVGMDYDGLVDLWKIGLSNKRTEEIESKRKRKQIGKFGIGKLAAHAIADRLTYITQNDQGKILSVTMDFKKFSSSATWENDPIHLPVRHINDWDKFPNDSYIPEILQRVGINPEMLPKTKSWTIAILEDLKGKARSIKEGRLRWVLRTAMPLGDSFRLYLNRQEVQSSKEDSEEIVTFDLKDLPKERLESLDKRTGETWYVQGESLKSDSFESGITGTVKVTKDSLYGGKSDELGRSHGFFVLVRGRLINEEDPLFGVHPMTYQIFNRLRAEIKVDDLDEELKASRETVEESSKKDHFQDLLREIFNEAYKQYQERKNPKEKKKTGQPKEGTKEIVAPRDMEYPTAGFLTSQRTDSQGTEADEDCFYIEEIDTGPDLAELIQSLYTTPRREFHYEYRGDGRTERLVKFNPQTSTFWLNQDHELVLEYANDEPSKRLLEDFVTAEALLEIYLRENKLSAHVVAHALEQRDGLLRKLIRNEAYALPAIANFLRDAAADANELENRIVDATRALGFVATRISGPGKPDGIARHVEYPGGEKKIILEAKSSTGIPTLSSLDFAGLQSHMEQKGAKGCLLVAPAYPGQSKEGNEVARRAQSHKISCWTVEQFAKFVEDAESHQFNARDLLDIVLYHFSPHEVTAKLEEMISQPSKNKSLLYRAILKSLQELEGRMTNESRNVGMITTEVSRYSEFGEITQSDVREAIRDLVGPSKGGMVLKDEEVFMNVSLEELEKRLSNFTKQSTNSEELGSIGINE